MKKLSYLALIPIAILALMPPVPWDIPIKSGWVWFISIFGFLGILTLFFNINPFVKCFAVLGFINTFFSACPYISHFAYIELIACIYLYIALTHIEDWNIVFNVLWAILGFNIIIFVMQLIHKDNLLNFGSGGGGCILSIGNGMQAKSLIIVLCALLLQDKRLRIRTDVAILGLFGLLLFCAYYFFAHNVWHNTLTYRGPVWIESIRLTMQHPFVGYGLGEFKVLFNTMASANIGQARAEGVWLTAHNAFIQLFFEMGLLGLLVAGLYLRNIWKKCFADKRLLAGLVLILFTLSVHFPDRQATSVLLLVLFFAFIDRKEYVNDN